MGTTGGDQLIAPVDGVGHLPYDKIWYAFHNGRPAGRAMTAGSRR